MNVNERQVKKKCLLSKGNYVFCYFYHFPVIHASCATACRVYTSVLILNVVVSINFFLSLSLHHAVYYCYRPIVEKFTSLTTI